MEKSQDRSNFSGRVGFILAAAGSAVGLGNLWRFPYLAAKYGGGIFLLVYLLLAVTFGFVLMTTEIAIGRKTRQSPLGAFGKLHSKWKGLGYLATLVPVIIMPYYSVIGGWVMKYGAIMLTGGVGDAANDSYFGEFISKTTSPLIWLFLFATITMIVVFLGVDKGIEKLSKVLMPVLVILSIGLSIFVITRPGAMEGVVYYLKPDFSKLTIKTVVAALGQLFYSMSLAMGIMVTYGSYVSADDHIEKSVRQIEIFDTAIAFLAGLMIIPSVFVFSGGNEDALGKGPSLMFVTLPKVFNDMKMGNIIGAVFFILVFFAALTSSISIMEAIVASMDDKFKLGRKKSTIIVYLFTILVGGFISLGFGVLDNIKILGLGLLDFFDFISNSVLMPIVALLTCILIGFILKPDIIVNEVELNGPFKVKKFYSVMIKWIAPLFLIAILVSSVLDVFGIYTI